MTALLCLLALVGGLALFFAACTARSATLRILGFFLAAAVVWSAVLFRLTDLSAGS